MQHLQVLSLPYHAAQIPCVLFRTNQLMDFFLVWTGDGLIWNGGDKTQQWKGFMTGLLFVPTLTLCLALMQHTVRCWMGKITSKWMLLHENFPIFTFLHIATNTFNVLFGFVFFFMLMSLMSVLLNVFFFQIEGFCFCSN